MELALYFLSEGFVLIYGYWVLEPSAKAGGPSYSPHLSRFDMIDDTDSWDEDSPIEIPIDGILDLHTFQPREVGQLVPNYLEACREKGILEVRVIHGKGTGTLRRTVQSLLGRIPCVVSFRQADPIAGGWGATIVKLLPPD